jgi:hypothetical protein
MAAVASQYNVNENRMKIRETTLREEKIKK